MGEAEGVVLAQKAEQSLLRSLLPLRHEQKSLLISMAFVGLTSATTSLTQRPAEALIFSSSELLAFVFALASSVSLAM